MILPEAVPKWWKLRDWFLSRLEDTFPAIMPCTPPPPKCTLLKDVSPIWITASLNERMAFFAMTKYFLFPYTFKKWKGYLPKHLKKTSPLIPPLPAAMGINFTFGANPAISYWVKAGVMKSNRPQTTKTGTSKAKNGHQQKTKIVPNPAEIQIRNVWVGGIFLFWV